MSADCMPDPGLGPRESKRNKELHLNREDQHDTTKDRHGDVVAVVASAQMGERGCHESIQWGCEQICWDPGRLWWGPWWPVRADSVCEVESVRGERAEKAEGFQGAGDRSRVPDEFT